MPPLPHKASNSGFGMIEVVVAFLLLSLSLGVLLGGLTTGMRNTDRAAQAGLALLYAESLLAETAGGVPLETGETSGRTDSGFAWRRRISRLPAAGQAMVAPVSINVSVTPPDGGAPVRLNTLRLTDIPSTDQLRR